MMNTTMGTSFAIGTIRLTAAAWRTPLAIKVMEEPHAGRGQRDSEEGVAFSQPRKEGPQCCHGEHKDSHAAT
jgi:hypothetical protein